MKKFLDSFSLNSILINEEATFHHNNQTSESQIDHVYYFIPEKSKFKIHLKEHICLKDEPSNFSSHDVIVGEIDFPVTPVDVTKEDFSSSYTPFIVKKPKWDDDGKKAYQLQTAKILHELSERYDKVEFIPTLCEMFSRTIQNLKTLRRSIHFSPKNMLKLIKLTKRYLVNGEKQEDRQMFCILQN